MSPLYNFSCPICGLVDERIVDYDTQIAPCEFCQGEAAKQFSFGQSFEVREDAPWLKSVIDVVDKESVDLIDRRFIDQPNRKNYQNWMRHHNLRPFENERDVPKRQPENIEVITHELLQMKTARERIEI